MVNETPRAHGLSIRLAIAADIPALRVLMNNSIRALQRPYLDDTAVEASFEIMGLDTQRITDGTYRVAELDGQLAGSGGWSRRATLSGGAHSARRDAALLSPAIDAMSFAPCSATCMHDCTR